jgi:P27 family predicted phage terminase small subunit
MGRRGPPPKPTALKLLNGNAGKQRLNDREPKPPIGAPRRPDWLSPEATKVWKRLVPQLRQMRVLTVVDADALAAYCHTFVRWRAAEEFLEQRGLVYPILDEKGRVRCMQQWPQVSIARHMLLVLRAYQQEFGLTPAARSRIHAEESDNAASDAHRWLG